MSIDKLLREARDLIREVTPEEAEKNLSDHVVVDVREPKEVLQGYLPGAFNIPRGTMEFRVMDDERFHDKERAILLYSSNGKRSLLAALTLYQMGFSNVTSLTGGLTRWSLERRPIE